MTIKSRFGSLFLFVFTAIIAASAMSCKKNNLYSKVYPIDADGWSMYNQLIFKVPVNDTLSSSDIMLTIRSDRSYPYRNIFLFVTTTSPFGYSVKDTIEYYLANEKGDWLGKGLGDIHEITVPFKTNVVFPYSGNYEFRIEQGMRTETLKGILDLGLTVVKRKNP